MFSIDWSIVLKVCDFYFRDAKCKCVEGSDSEIFLLNDTKLCWSLTIHTGLELGLKHSSTALHHLLKYFQYCRCRASHLLCQRIILISEKCHVSHRVEHWCHYDHAPAPSPLSWLSAALPHFQEVRPARTHNIKEICTPSHTNMSKWLKKMVFKCRLRSMHSLWHVSFESLKISAEMVSFSWN